jgi:hypothetical protein
MRVELNARRCVIACSSTNASAKGEIGRYDLGGGVANDGRPGKNVIADPQEASGRAIVFRRREDGFYEFSGEASLGRILAGTVCTKTVVAPTGFERLWTLDFRGVLP